MLPIGSATIFFHLFSFDMKRAYFFAKVRRPIFIEIPVEDREFGDENKVGRFNLSFYGVRGAATNWQDEFIGTFLKAGFEKGAAPREIFTTSKGRWALQFMVVISFQLAPKRN